MSLCLTERGTLPFEDKVITYRLYDSFQLKNQSLTSKKFLKIINSSALLIKNIYCLSNTDNLA